MYPKKITSALNLVIGWERMEQWQFLGTQKTFIENDSLTPK